MATPFRLNLKVNRHRAFFEQRMIPWLSLCDWFFDCGFPNIIGEQLRIVIFILFEKPHLLDANLFLKSYYLVNVQKAKNKSLFANAYSVYSL